MIPKLPHWVLTDRYPAFYDAESKTAVGMVARLYGKMQEIIDDYNKMIDNMNETIELFTSSHNKNWEAFEVALRQEFQDFIDVVDIKLQEQDEELRDAINFMKLNLSNSITTTINEMKLTGELDQAILDALQDALNVQVSYEAPTESLYVRNAVLDIVSFNEPSEELMINTTSLTDKEDVINKVTTISSESTDTEYPTAKAVYEAINGTDTEIQEQVKDNVSEILGGEY